MKIVKLGLSLLVMLSFFACNQDDIGEMATRSDVVKKSDIPDDNWHAALDITEALDTVSLQIAEKKEIIKSWHFLFLVKKKVPDMDHLMDI